MSLLPLPLSLHQADRYVLTPALALLPSRMDTPEARVMVHAICLQESRYAHRRQIRGPARGFAQFELGGGVSGVLRHKSSASLAQQVCIERGVEPKPKSVYDRLDQDDVLALAFARLLLWTDPKPLPEIGDAEGALGYYLRNWRPGKPHPQTWPGLYRRAAEAVNGAQGSGG